MKKFVHLILTIALSYNLTIFPIARAEDRPSIANLFESIERKSDAGMSQESLVQNLVYEILNSGYSEQEIFDYLILKMNPEQANQIQSTLKTLKNHSLSMSASQKQLLLKRLSKSLNQTGMTWSTGCTFLMIYPPLIPVIFGAGVAGLVEVIKEKRIIREGRNGGYAAELTTSKKNLSEVETRISEIKANTPVTSLEEAELLKSLLAPLVTQQTNLNDRIKVLSNPNYANELDTMQNWTLAASIAAMVVPTGLCLVIDGE